MSNERKTVVIEDVRFMLANGVTRLKDDKNYNETLGSIEEYYGLTPNQIKLIFRDERMKGMKFKKVAAPQFILSEGERTIDTLPTMQNTTVSTTANESVTIGEDSEVEVFEEA